MATQTLSTFDALLKNVYRGPIVELLNQNTYMIDQLEKTNANNLGTFSGRQLMFPVHTARNRGRGAVTDGGTLPTAGKQSALDGIVTMNQFGAGIEITHQTILQSKTDEGSFVRALTYEMDGAATDMRKDINRIAFGTGDGLLASVLASTNSTVISVDSGQYIAIGDTVDVLTRTNGTSKVSAVAVTGVSFTGSADSSTQTNANITLASAANVTNADGVYISGDRSNESAGLRNITSTGRVLFQIDSSSNPIWDGNVVDAANSAISEDLMIQLAQQIKQRTGTDIDTYVTSLGVQRRLARQYTSQKRWNDDHVLQQSGGYSTVMIAAGNTGVPVIADTDAPYGFAFALNKSSFAWAEGSKPDWLSSPDGNGQVLHLKDGSTAGTKVATWQAWMYWPATLVTVAANRNGQVKNLNDNVPVVRDQ
jgi:hypothetical protein